MNTTHIDPDQLEDFALMLAKVLEAHQEGRHNYDGKPILDILQDSAKTLQLLLNNSDPMVQMTGQEQHRRVMSALQQIEQDNRKAA